MLILDYLKSMWNSAKYAFVRDYIIPLLYQHKHEWRDGGITVTFEFKDGHKETAVDSSECAICGIRRTNYHWKHFNIIMPLISMFNAWELYIITAQEFDKDMRAITTQEYTCDDSLMMKRMLEVEKNPDNNRSIQACREIIQRLDSEYQAKQSKKQK